MLMLSV